MKKLLLILGLFGLSACNLVDAVHIRSSGYVPVGYGVNVGVETQKDLSTIVVLSLVAGALLSKIAYDVSWQITYFTKTQELYFELINAVKDSNITSVDQLIKLEMFDLMTRDEIVTLDSWIRCSYTSWLTPWNWTRCQKNSYVMAQVLSIIVLHGELLGLGDEVTGSDIERSARSICSVVSMYPLVYYGQELDRHIDFIKNHSSDIKNTKMRTMIQGIVHYLAKIKYLLRQEPSYSAEMQAFEIHKLLMQIRNTQAANGGR